MNYKDFLEYVKGNIRGYLPVDYQDRDIIISPTEKNNGVMMMGLKIKKEGQSLVTNLYLESFYEEYQQGKKPEDVMRCITNAYLEAQKTTGTIGVPEVLNFHTAKDAIVFQVVNRKQNADSLREIPHKNIMNLTQIYRIDISGGEIGPASVKVTNRMMKEWGINQEELHDLAVKNTLNVYPPVLRNIGEAILGIGEDNPVNLLDGTSGSGAGEMYILTNREAIYGATVMLYPETLAKVGEIIGNDFYILPSSVHEVILVPKKSEISPRELGNMVREINRKQVSPEERLADCVYEYIISSQEMKQVKESLPKNRDMER